MTDPSTSPLAGLTGELARTTALGDPGRAPALMTAASRSLVDTVSCVLAASGSDLVLAVMDANRARTGRGSSTVLFTGERAEPQDASLLNATAAHALDYDDGLRQLIGHPGTLLVPVALAVGEYARAPGRAVHEALALGLWVDSAMSVGIGAREVYRAGWHTTTVIGVLGATAVAGRLLRLPQPAQRHAFGLAASAVGGSRDTFGTMGKAVNVGLAADLAVRSCLLAARGVTGHIDAMEAPSGYFARYGGETADAAHMRAILRDPFACPLDYTQKRYPCCHHAQPIAEAALGVLGGRAELTSADVERLLIRAPEDAVRILEYAEPHDGLEAKFSAHYVAAAALHDRAIGLSSFTDAAVGREPIRALLGRTDFEAHEDGERAGADIHVRFSDGTNAHATCTAPKGDASRPLDRDDRLAKLEDCAAFGGAAIPAGGLFRRLEALAEVPDVTAVTGALRQKRS